MMNNNELKKIMNDNRNDIAKASRLGLGIVLGAVILIGVIFYVIAPKARVKDSADSSAASSATDSGAKDSSSEGELQEEPGQNITVGHLYRVFSDTVVYSSGGGQLGEAAEGEIYASYDSLDILEFGKGKKIEIKYYSQTGYILADDLVEVTSAVILPTAADSRIRDEEDNVLQCSPADCGAVAAAALVNSQTKRSWETEDIISTAETLGTNGDIARLINACGGGDLIAKKLSGDTKSTLINCINEGKRVLLAVRYYDGVADFDYSDFYEVYSDTRYVVVCGYIEDEEGNLRFYCCDPFYGNNGRSLATVSSETLCESAGLVDDARRCMIVLH